MIQRGHGTDFALETVAEPLGGYFYGDLAAHARIAGAVNLTHAACAEGRQDLVGAEAGSGGEAHLACPAKRRRTSSKKFSSKVTWLWLSRNSGPSAGISPTKRLPSGARS